MRVVGKEPAQNVAGFAWLLPIVVGDVDAKTILDLQKKRCDDAIKAPLRGQTIIAGQEPEIEIYAGGDGFADMHNRFGVTKFLPYVVGCIMYQESDGTPHWTGLTYQLAVRDPAGKINGVDFSLPNGRGPTDQIVILPAESGSGPAN